MCFFYGLNKAKKQIELEFDAKFDQDGFEPTKEVNGFAHPHMSIIVDKSPNIITAVQWGLLPIWPKDTSFQKNTLNARIESLSEKASFKTSLKNRLIIKRKLTQFSLFLLLYYFFYSCTMFGF